MQTNIIFHSIRLTLCFQQAGEIDNLTVSLGQSSLIVLCADSTSTVQTPCDSYFLAPLTTFWRVAAPTGSITLVSFWGKTCCWLHHTFLLGFPANVWSTPSISATVMRKHSVEPVGYQYIIPITHDTEPYPRYRFVDVYHESIIGSSHFRLSR